ncbi:unnamed protein product [Ostreobium quekettii]|uniref:DUF899 domain-containing protein n=1 Tax=Ostreobium quekettii TaxID=121088 RepID=A0A8S1IZ02_9CHLO|nr:unnamed protein product [Ostreobium quekettii]
MPPPRVASREERDRLRRELLDAEKALTRQGDEVARQRRALPWVRVEKDYSLRDADGRAVQLSELFREGTADLVVYHFACGPGADDPCDQCCCWVEGFDAYAPFFDGSFGFAVVAGAPHERLRALTGLRGWTLPMYSSAGSDFSQDFAVEGYEEEGDGTGGAAPRSPALSVFRKEDGVVYCTYSTSGRGLEVFNPVWAFLDTLPNGREGWHQEHRHLCREKRPHECNGSDESSKKPRSAG